MYSKYCKPIAAFLLGANAILILIYFVFSSTASEFEAKTFIQTDSLYTPISPYQNIVIEKTENSKNTFIRNISNNMENNKENRFFSLSIDEHGKIESYISSYIGTDTTMIVTGFNDNGFPEKAIKVKQDKSIKNQWDIKKIDNTLEFINSEIQ